MIMDGMKDGSVLKNELEKFLKKGSRMYHTFEILVSCDPYDDSGTRIQWANASPHDNMKCGNCNIWTFDGGDCECDRYIQTDYSDEPLQYRNGVIMKLQSPKGEEDKIIQVKYVKDSKSKFFCDGCID